MATTVVHDGTTIPTVSPKDIDSTVWYGFNYTLQSGETISTSVWLIEGVLVVNGDEVNGLTLVDVDLTGVQTQAQLQGGVIGDRYKVTNRISTNMTPSDDKSMSILVTQL